jgi:hypothetical protein
MKAKREAVYHILILSAEIWRFDHGFEFAAAHLGLVEVADEPRGVRPRAGYYCLVFKSVKRTMYSISYYP